MISLKELLFGDKHRHLELIAHAYNISFRRGEANTSELEKLYGSLNLGAYEKAFKTLETDHIEALQALRMGDGWLPLPLFEYRFGKIRLHRPFHYPSSVAEHLYHLGFIHIRDREMVGIVTDVITLLPVLPKGEDTPSTNGTRNLPSRAELLHDMYILLSAVMQVQSYPASEQWISLSIMGKMFLRLGITEDISEQDSELETRRLYWLHYLAQVAGLLSIQNGVFTPTIFAWRWMSAPSELQWNSLIQAVEHDLSAEHSLWDSYEFPKIQASR